MVTVGEANARRLCLNCVEPDALLLRHKDGRYLRACRSCLGLPLLDDWNRNCVFREPLPEEGGPPMQEPDYVEDGLCWYGRFAPESMRRCTELARWHWPEAPTTFGRAVRWCLAHRHRNDTELPAAPRVPDAADGMGGAALTVEAARTANVCRICGKPGPTPAGPKGWQYDFGELVWPEQFTLSFGREYAHTDCLNAPRRHARSLLSPRAPNEDAAPAAPDAKRRDGRDA